MKTDDAIGFLATLGIIFWLGVFALVGCQGPRGTAGIVGPAGSIGPTGLPGQNGLQGSPGVPGRDGTAITSVQLCPGYAATSYPEVGLCIDGKLYGEYYAPPSSGLVYLPDGNYVSTQTGAPCSFTVTGCGVQ